MDWLKNIRKQKGLTTKEVAKLAGCSQISIYKIEAGERTPSVTVAKAIARVLDFHWTRFYEDLNEQNKAN